MATLLLSSALIGLSGCQLDNAFGNEDQIEVVQSDLARELNPDVSDQELEELVQGNTSFALDLYRELSAEAGNQFYSPLSISLALAMLYGGARGETEQEMANALNFTLPQDQLHAAFNELDLALAARDEDQEGFQLNIANATWGQRGHEFLSAYLDLLAVNYGAAMRLLDFASSPDESREVINNWVSDRTDGNIENLLPEGSISDLTKLVLTNAIYFNAEWQVPFPKEATHDATFTRLDGTQIDVPTMSQTLTVPYVESDGVVAIELPYKGEAFSMLILMPQRDAFGAFEQSLTTENLMAILDNLEITSLRLSLPKFDFAAEYDMIPMLRALGMEQAFTDGEADFSGIDGARELLVTGIFHQAFVAVDEEGTEAGAATGVVVGPTSAPGQDVRIDQPFLFVICDRSTRSALFMGRVLDPSS